MLADTLAQAKLLIEKSGNTLVVFRNDLTGDALCASLGLALALKKQNKEVQLICGEASSDKFSFLPGSNLAQGSLKEEAGTLVLKLKNARSGIGEFWYEEDGNDLRFFIAPRNESFFKKSDLEIDVKGAKPDLIVCVGLPVPESAGPFFENNAALFYETPIINIDISSMNEGYGSVNLIDLTSSANSEVAYDLLNAIDPGLIDEEIATVLLAGIIAKTDSFQSLKTTPRSLFAAAELMEKGADQQEIVRNLYKTKTLGLLKLWGRALSRLTIYPEHQAIMSSLSAGDLRDTGAGRTEIEHVVEELASTLSDARVILLLAELGSEKISGYIFTKPQYNTEELLLEFKAHRVRNGLAAFDLAGPNLEEAEKTVADKLIGWLKSIQHV